MRAFEVVFTSDEIPFSLQPCGTARSGAIACRTGRHEYHLVGLENRLFQVDFQRVPIKREFVQVEAAADRAAVISAEAERAVGQARTALPPRTSTSSSSQSSGSGFQTSSAGISLLPTPSRAGSKANRGSCQE